MNHIRAKFQLVSADKHEHGVNVSLIPVYGDSEENKTYSKWTPYGELKLGVTNPDVQDFFEPGFEYVTLITKQRVEEFA